MPTISRSLAKAIKDVHEMALQRGHEYMTLDHLLLALTNDKDARIAMLACGVNPDSIEARVNTYLESLDNKKQSINLDTESQDSENTTLSPTTAFENVLNRASIHVHGAGRTNQVTGANVLIAMYSERRSHAMQLLDEFNLTRFDLTRYMAHGVSKISDIQETGATQSLSEEAIEAFLKQSSRRKTKKSPLEIFCVDLEQKAKTGAIDPLIGRETEVQRCFQTLLRRSKNNPLLVGDPGVGKTSIVEGIAKNIYENKVPEALRGFKLYSLNMGTLIAGSRFRGEFEDRLTKVIKAIIELENAILFIDEVHTLVGAGAAQGGSMDASNILKPSLQDGSLRCIGSTTHKDFKQHFEKDRALSRRFQKIDVPEPTRIETVKILRGLRQRYEKHHSVKFTDDALNTTVELAGRYINNRKFPDKAIDVIDEAGAAQRLRPESKRRKSIRAQEIEETVSKIARIPSRQLSKSDANVLVELDSNLKLVVYGQDSAIESLTSAIKLSRAGLREPEKPIGAYLFTGPTGVGKTEVARQLSETLGAKLLRFDMSEFMEKHTVSRLIGAPPGYVGFDQGGLLTDGVDENPHCVILFDEIEKAHPDVSNILLQVMDYGKLTDHSGRTVDFRNTVIIMTTNAGAVEQAKSALGFARDRREGEDTVAIEKLFAPEFRNRLDAIISFGSLSDETIIKVVEKFVTQLEGQLIERNVNIEISRDAAAWLASKGYNNVMGARPLARLIQEKIKKPLADEILFGKLKSGGLVIITLENNELCFEFKPPERKRISAIKVPLLAAK